MGVGLQDTSEEAEGAKDVSSTAVLIDTSTVSR